MLSQALFATLCAAPAILAPSPAATMTPRSQEGAGGGAHGEEPPAGLEEALSHSASKDEAEEALVRFRVPAGFRAELFASEPLLANPVAFCFDVFGRAYVAETFRHSKGVTDMREHMDWLEDDIAIKTVADRVAMFRKHEGDAGLEAGYAVETERVTRVVDTDGDGVADASTVFADGFTDPAVGIGAGVLARPLDGQGATGIWFTCIPELWRLFDLDNDGVAEERSAQSTGYGLRVALLGHDLHGLVIGPDGRMYFSMGDRGFNVTTAEGEHLVRYGTGAVLRCELDGTDLEIFCDGLRNPQELSFDDYGNLFTLDNNSDGGDQARWTWLLSGSDSGWRQAYQWVTSPTSRGPWNEELMWKPFHSEQPAFILPPIANFTSGPSGLTQYPGTGFGEEWRGRFFVCDFRGAPGYSGIYAFGNERQGAGFKLGATQEFVWDALPTDVDFGIDGNLYWSDWVSGWNQTGKGRLYRVVPTDRPEAERLAIESTRVALQRLAAEGAAGSGSGAARGQEASLARASGYSDEELVELFLHRDRRVRQEAQLALAHRALAEEDPRAGYEHLVPALKRLREPTAEGDRQERTRVARLHALWATWHVARRSEGLGADLPKYLIQLLFDPDAELVAQAARTLGELSWLPAADRIPPLLLHDSPRVRLFAAEALGGLGAPDTSVGPLVELLAETAATDPWLRHGVIHALERLGSPGDVHELMGHGSASVRRAAAVVLRRWGDDAIAALLDDPNPLVRAEAARAIYDGQITAAMDDLAAFLDRAPDEATEPLTWRRAVHACREVGTPEAALSLASFAASGRGTEDARADAMDLLRRWAEPLTRDGILQDHRPLPGGERSAVTALVDHRLFQEALLAERFGSAGPGQSRELKSLVALHRNVPSPESAAVLASVAADEALDLSLRRQAYEGLLGEFPGATETQGVTDRILESDSSPLLSMAIGTLPDEVAAGRLMEMISAEGGDGCAEAVRILGSMRGPVAMEAFGTLGTSLQGIGDPSLVEWLEAAADHPSAGVSTVAAGLEESWAAEGPLVGWTMCLEGGDPVAGAEIFTTKAETSCTKCHMVGDQGGSEAGPNLDDVGSRLPAESLLRSIVEPNAEIAEGFQSWILALHDGDVFSGRIVEESEELLVLETSDKEQLEFTPDEIRQRRQDVSAMPADVASHLTRREMRDLLAYLKSLK